MGSYCEVVVVGVKGSGYGVWDGGGGCEGEGLWGVGWWWA